MAQLQREKMDWSVRMQKPVIINDSGFKLNVSMGASRTGQFLAALAQENPKNDILLTPACVFTVSFE